MIQPISLEKAVISLPCESIVSPLPLPPSRRRPVGLMQGLNRQIYATHWNALRCGSVLDEAARLSE